MKCSANIGRALFLDGSWRIKHHFQFRKTKKAEQVMRFVCGSARQCKQAVDIRIGEIMDGACSGGCIQTKYKSVVNSVGFV